MSESASKADMVQMAQLSSNEGEEKNRTSSDLHKSTDSPESASAEQHQMARNESEYRRFADAPRTAIGNFGNRARSATTNIPDFLKPLGPVSRFFNTLGTSIAPHLNFYRIHLLVFTITPFIFSGIFYASNSNHIAYIDCLFACVSAMTVTGLTTINLSTATAWQQAILFFLMCIGNITFVSILTIYVRKHFFRKKFDEIIRKSAKARKRMNDLEYSHEKEKRKDRIRFQRMLGLKKRHQAESRQTTEGVDEDRTQPYESQYVDQAMTRSSSVSIDEQAEAELKAELAAKMKQSKKKKKGLKGPLRASMIRRIDEPAILVNQMGSVSKTVPERNQHQQDEQNSTNPAGILNVGGGGGGGDDDASELPAVRIQEPSVIRNDNIAPRSASPEHLSAYEEAQMHDVVNRRQSHATIASSPTKARFGDADVQEHRRPSDPLSRNRRGSLSGDIGSPRLGFRHDMFPRAQTIEFADSPHPSAAARSSAFAHSPSVDTGLRHRPTGIEFQRTATNATQRSLRRTPTTSMEQGFGGFPGPFAIAGAVIKRTLPGVQERFKQSTTMPRTATFASAYSAGGMDGRTQTFLSYDVTVSRNSRFHGLTQVQKDELGGVEYRALEMLGIIVPIYYLGVYFFCIVLVAPWAANRSAAKNLHGVIASQGIDGPNPVWFWFFSCMSAYSNTGFSLIDTSYILLNDQYFMLIPTAFLILAGNTAFPVFLRFFIWIISKCVPQESRASETLQYILSFPRRTFLLLFGSGQTWFLFLVIMSFTCFDWVMFQVLDINNPILDSWSIGTRIFDGLFQAIAVRSAGFQIISILSLASAVQVLYTLMMYIAVMPISMSIRNSNVYEERSLGVYNEQPSDDAEEPAQADPRLWGRYLGAHIKNQLSFDLWWLGLALWIICIVERYPLQDPASDSYFTIFTVLFELVSAYGTVGLSTGLTTQNYSLSGAFHTLSKLVVIAVMIRGRHRGLPNAVDRSILLPKEIEYLDAEEEEEHFMPQTTTMQSMRARRMSEASALNLDQKQSNKEEYDEELASHHPITSIREVNTPLPSTTVSHKASYGMFDENVSDSFAKDKGKAQEGSRSGDERSYALRFGSS